jgi:L-alanine-DL-glutamate epimerase-like enolase superfamily enzyme
MRRKVNTRILVMAARRYPFAVARPSRHSPWQRAVPVATWHGPAGFSAFACWARGGGLLEVDSNGNLPRARFCGPVANISDGMVTPGDDPGLGIEPDLSSIETYRTV